MLYFLYYSVIFVSVNNKLMYSFLNNIFFLIRSFFAILFLMNLCFFSSIGQLSAASTPILLHAPLSTSNLYCRGLAVDADTYNPCSIYTSDTYTFSSPKDNPPLPPGACYKKVGTSVFSISEARVICNTDGTQLVQVLMVPDMTFESIVTTYFNKLIVYIFGITLGICVLVIVVSGTMMAFGQGGVLKTRIISALIGLFILLFAGLIMNTINPNAFVF